MSTIDELNDYKARIEYLQRLWKKVDTSRTNFNDDVKTTRSNLEILEQSYGDSPVISNFIKSRMADGTLVGSPAESRYGTAVHAISKGIESYSITVTCLTQALERENNV